MIRHRANYAQGCQAPCQRIPETTRGRFADVYDGTRQTAKKIPLQRRLNHRWVARPAKARAKQQRGLPVEHRALKFRPCQAICAANFCSKAHHPPPPSTLTTQPITSTSTTQPNLDTLLILCARIWCLAFFSHSNSRQQRRYPQDHLRFLTPPRAFLRLRQRQ